MRARKTPTIRLTINYLFIAVFLVGAASTRGQVVISEFMAKNDETLIDGDGNYSDWIELYNTSESAVDLTGWYLSDDTNNLAQWPFPSTSIAAGAHLVVFASGQDGADYVDAAGYFHTTFKLAGDGESVVLTRPDGTTIEHAFIGYPEQADDISYGLARDTTYSTLITEGEDARALAGTSEPSASWKTAAFDDASWQSGQLGVGFEDVETVWTGGGRPPRDWQPEEEVYTDLINLDIAGMLGVTESAYIRVDFTLDGSEDLAQLALRMKYDDGFVAYVNGQQVAAANAPAAPTFASSATAEHVGSSYEDFTILNADAFLQTGDNVLAIHGLNMANDETDFFISPLLTGVSVGELQTNTMMYLDVPTPGAKNLSGVLGYVGDTTFSVDRGFFTNAFEVAIACETAGAAIYYTVDGTTPATDNGTLYDGPITIDRTTILRAAAFATGWQPSDVDTQTYLFLSDIVAQDADVSGVAPYFPPSAVNGQDFDYGMDTAITQSGTYAGEMMQALMSIPSISMVTDPDNLFDPTSGIYVNADQEGEAWERQTSLELLNPDGSDGFQINGGMRIRGESSARATNPKHSFRFMFRSEYGTSRLNYPLFGDDGADSFKRIDLRTGQNFSWANQSPQYATWLYDIFTRDTHRDMNQPSTLGEYYHLYINGMYWGLYQTEERCDSRFAASYYGGDSDDFDAVKADGDTGDLYAVDGTRGAYEDLWAGLTAGVDDNASYFALQGMSADGTENAAYTHLLDVDNVIDYMLLIYFTANRDSPIGPPGAGTMPRNLTSVYNRAHPDGFKYVAHDNEHSLEIQEGVSHNRFTQTLASSFDGIDRMTPWWMHEKLMGNPEYALRFADHVHEHFFNEGLLTATANAERMETRKNEIYSAVVAESARWGDSAGTLRTRNDDWLVWADWLTDTYMAQRTAIVYNQIVAKGWYPSVSAPILSQHGGSIDAGFSLSMTGSGTIYYTIDGTDPRAVGGAVAGMAYDSAIPLDHSAQVKARVLSGGTWSALTQATFILNEASPLRVTEIMYNPAEPVSGAETNFVASDFEFIELLNTGSSTVGLAGVEFSDGIQFDFTEGALATLAPGAYAVLVSDFAAFTNRYDAWASMQIAGEFHGRFFIADAALDNGGEEIVLRDGLGNTILDFEYNDGYALTDGEGFSLTLIDPTAATNTWGDAGSWRASKYVGGTPGAAPEDFLDPDDLVINEALTHQDADNPGDWVELYNASTNALDINGWFISDDEDNPAKVELSGLPTIAAGGYLTLSEYAHFGLAAAGTNGFALSELGDEIVLSSGEGGKRTGYRVSVSFGAIARDDTFGRHVKSTGASDFAIQSAPSPNAANEYPLVGPVVISEIMYHPAGSNAFEYVEIVNTGSSAVPLYHATYPTNTWRLEGAVSFAFPEGTVLDPGACIVVTETNAAAFGAYYVVPAGVTVLGPYAGQLANEGEELLLTKPGDPEALTGEVPYIEVERVDFEDSAPWPTAADGLGASLERASSSSYPNDPAHWNANWDLAPGTVDFSDGDEDGMPDAWEIEHFGSTNAPHGGADEDWDLDGTTNGDEWTAGTDPTDPASLFMIQAFDIGTGRVLTWSSETGKVYAVWMSTNLVSGEYGLIADQIAATPPENSYDAGTNESACAFYTLTVEDE